MQETESMDLKHSDTLDSVGDSYIPNSKSTDLIKPSKSGNLDSQQTPGEDREKKFYCSKWRIFYVKVCKYLWKAFSGNEKNLFYLLFK